MRATQFVQKPTASQLKSFSNARNGNYMITSQHGPTGFTVLEIPGADPAMPVEELLELVRRSKKEFRVTLGSPHSCSCVQGFKQHFCPHIAFLILRKYKIPETSQLAFQTAWTDAELESVLQGTHIAALKPHKREKESIIEKYHDDNGQARPRAEITEDTYCAICLEQLAGMDPSILPFCGACGNSVHERCLYMLLASSRTSKMTPKCIYCREPWKDGRSQVYSNGMAAKPSKERSGSRLEISSRIACSVCHESFGEGGFATRKFWGERICFFCLFEMQSGHYELNGRDILEARTQPAHEASNNRYLRFAYFENRDITEADYDALLRLDEPVMPIGPPQRLQLFLALRGLRENRSGELFQCQLCGCQEINLCALLEIFEFAEPALDWETFGRELKDNESAYDANKARDFFDTNTEFFLPCAQHAIHGFCALVCACKKAVLRINEVRCEAKVFADACPVCSFPCVPEWLRGATLGKKKRAAEADLPEDDVEPQGLRIGGIALRSQQCTQQETRALQYNTLEPSGRRAAPAPNAQERSQDTLSQHGLLNCLRVNALPALK